MISEDTKMIVDKAEQAIKILAEKMGMANQEFWPTFIRKQILDAVPIFIWLIIWGGVAMWLLPICFSWPRTENVDQYDIDGLYWGMRSIGLVVCGFVIGHLYSAIDQLKFLLNLRYWAFKDYMETLKNLIPSS